MIKNTGQRHQTMLEQSHQTIRDEHQSVVLKPCSIRLALALF